MPENGNARFDIRNLTQYFSAIRNGGELPVSGEKLNIAFSNLYPSNPRLHLGDHYVMEIPEQLPDVFSGEESIDRVWLYLTNPSAPPMIKFKINLRESGSTTLTSPFENLPAAYIARATLERGGAVVPIDTAYGDMSTRRLNRSPLDPTYILILLTILMTSTGITYELTPRNKMGRRRFMKVMTILAGSVLTPSLVSIPIDIMSGKAPMATNEDVMNGLVNFAGRNPREWPSYEQVKVSFRNIIMAYGMHLIGNHLRSTHSSAMPLKSIFGTFGNGHVEIINKFTEGPEKLAEYISEYARNLLSGILELVQNKKVSLDDARRLIFESSLLFPSPEWITATYPFNSFIESNLKTPKLLFINELIKSIEELKKQDESNRLVLELENALKAILFEVAMQRISIESRIKELDMEASRKHVTTNDLLGEDNTRLPVRPLYSFSNPYTLSEHPSSGGTPDLQEAVTRDTLRAAYGDDNAWTITGCSTINGLVYPIFRRDYKSNSGENKTSSGILISSTFLPRTLLRGGL